MISRVCLSGNPGELTLSVSHDDVEVVRREMMLGTEEVEHPGNRKSITCETLVPEIVELVYETFR